MEHFLFDIPFKKMFDEKKCAPNKTRTPNPLLLRRAPYPSRQGGCLRVRN